MARVLVAAAPASEVTSAVCRGGSSCVALPGHRVAFDVESDFDVENANVLCPAGCWLASGW